MVKRFPQRGKLLQVNKQNSNMKLTEKTGNSKIAARIRNMSGRIRKQISVTVSEHGPESIQLTGALPRTKGWHVALDVPIRQNGRKDYVKFLMETKVKEIWIKVSTAGGRSKIYVR
jgi:hypothetical protein